MLPEREEAIKYLKDFFEPIFRPLDQLLEPPAIRGSERFNIPKAVIGAVGGFVVGELAFILTLGIVYEAGTRLLNLDQNILFSISAALGGGEALAITYLTAIHAGYNNFNRFNFFRPKK